MTKPDRVGPPSPREDVVEPRRQTAAEAYILWRIALLRCELNDIQNPGAGDDETDALALARSEAEERMARVELRTLEDFDIALDYLLECAADDMDADHYEIIGNIKEGLQKRIHAPLRQDLLRVAASIESGGEK